MRKSIFKTLSIIAVLTFVFISCKGTPDAVDAEHCRCGTACVCEPGRCADCKENCDVCVSACGCTNEKAPSASVSAAPAAAEQPRVDVSGLRNQMAQIEKARKMAMDFESPAYFPSDWEYVEHDYSIVKGIASDEKEILKITESDVKEGTEWLNDILNAYNGLFKKSVPLYAQAREDEIMVIREELINTGLAGHFPEYLKSPDKKAITALDQYEAEDYYAARDTAVLAIDEYETLLLGAVIYLTREELISTGLTYRYPELLRNADKRAFTALDQYEADDYDAARKIAVDVLSEYEALLLGTRIVFRIEDIVDTGLTLPYPEYLTYADSLAFDAVDLFEEGKYEAAKEKGAQAYKAYDDLLFAAMIYLRRQEILNRGFYVYDMDNFDNADDVALDAIGFYEGGNKMAAEQKAEEAFLRYNVLLTNGWVSYAVDRRTFTSSERDRAMSERVNIAMRESFREADLLYSQAEEYYKSERYDEAANLFTEAEALFTVARLETADRRRRAEEAIRNAEQGIQGSRGAAIEAERIIEGGSR